VQHKRSQFLFTNSFLHFSQQRQWNQNHENDDTDQNHAFQSPTAELWNTRAEGLAANQADNNLLK
jgi:hypothetical protein